MYLNVENGRFLYNCNCSCIPLRFHAASPGGFRSELFRVRLGLYFLLGRMGVFSKGVETLKLIQNVRGLNLTNFTKSQEFAKNY
jgi:hypothetical protein